MEQSFLKSTSLILIVGLFLALTTSGCKKDDQNEPPALPPQSSMVIDFSDFMASKSSEADINNTYVNRALAITHVAVWNTVIFVNLAVPVATFKEAFNHEAKLQPDGSWKWSFDVTVGIHTYTASLFGKVEGINVDWKMYVSKTGPGAFTDYLWYTGTSKLSGETGTWTLNHSAGNNSAYVYIEWFKNADETFGIKYTNVVSGSIDNGSYISHGRTKDSPFNAYYSLFNKSQNNLTEIKWSTTTKAGQIKDPKIYGNSSFYCWDASGKDVSCN